MDDESAWAAGLFEGEGSATSHFNAKRARSHPELLVYQAGGASAPEVLLRFQEIVSCGTLLGPVRGRLWCWREGAHSEIERVIALMWPWLGTTKRRQVLDMATRVDNAELQAALNGLPGRPELMSRALAPWAAGFFVGEGWIARIASARWPQLRAGITQASASGVPDTLVRFKAAVGGHGTISGPTTGSNPWSRLPQYRWYATSNIGTQTVIDLLWPWLDERKRRQASTAMSMMNSEASRKSSGRSQT